MPINVIPIYWPPISDAERANYHYHGNAQGMESDTSPNPNNIGARLVNIIPLSLPNLRRSDNDPFVVSGSASIDRTAGTMLRPGMTIVLDGIPTFDDIYMITGVNFDHFSTNPVQIEFTKPDREAKYVQTFAVGPTFVDYGNTTDSSALITKTRII